MFNTDITLSVEQVQDCSAQQVPATGPLHPAMPSRWTAASQQQQAPDLAGRALGLGQGQTPAMLPEAGHMLASAAMLPFQGGHFWVPCSVGFWPEPGQGVPTQAQAQFLQMQLAGMAPQMVHPAIWTLPGQQG